MLPSINVSCELTLAFFFYPLRILILICVTYVIVFRSFRPLLLTLAADKATLIRERSWMQLNYSEPALVEASLALVSLHHAFTESAPVDGAVMHQVKAVRIINSRLNDPATAATDGVLGAVWTLAHCEVCFLQFLHLLKKLLTYLIIASSKEGGRV